ncbi:unnamed protein product [Durusdinium trenchii]|uniref:Lysine histidine transporter 1 n=2 Tax=Durusdinium trenchii TaxID=1381693 RepID=A0ABP0J8S4_9DINO
MSKTATWDSDDAMDSDDSDLKELYGHNGVLLTAGIIAADVIGAGILAMPAAMANLGLYAGTAALIALLLANVHVSMVMWRVRMNCPTCVGATTYTALVQGAFAKAPAWQQEIMIHLTSFSQKSFLFGMMVLYLLSAGKGFGMIFHHVHVCLPNWMIYAAFLLFPFAASARHLGSWQSLVWINVVSLMGTVLIPLCFYALNGTEKIRVPGSHVEAVSELSPRQILSSLSTFFFGMTSQFMLLEIIAEMKDPMELPKAYAGYFAPFQLVMFSLAGIAGYWYMGNKVGGMMNENLPFGPSLQAAAGCMLVHMLISYLIKGVVVCKSIHRAVDKRYAHGSDTRPRSWMVWVFIVAFMLLLSWFSANLVPFFGAAVDFLGASVTPISCWLIPLLLYMRMCWDFPEEAEKSWTLEWILIALECLLALILVVFGVRSSLLKIIETWSTYGAPFDCHCEGLWETCGCSAEHAGMATQCPGV